MSITVELSNIDYFIPEYNDIGWAQGIGNLTDYLVALATNVVQINGSNSMTGNLTLTANSNIILQDSESTPQAITLAVPSPITTGYTLTLPVTAGSNGQVLSTNGSGTTSWVNAAGGGTVNSGTTGQLAYYAGNGTTVGGETMSGDATIAAGGALTIASGAITNAKVSASAAIALSKLASTTAYYWYVANGSGVLTPVAISPNLAVYTDANGSPRTNLTTGTELGYVHGVTSAIQTQLNGLLPLSGGTMSGVINMASNKIISVMNATNPGDAVAYNQLNTNAAGYIIGTIAQISQGTSTTSQTTSGSYGTTNLSSGLTPKANTHKIKISVTGSVAIFGGGIDVQFTIYRNGTDLDPTGHGFSYIESQTANAQSFGVNIIYIDSPATTSALTYTLYQKTNSSGGASWNSNTGTTVLLLEEIAE